MDLLVSIHRWSRGLASHLGPFRGVARKTFRTLFALRYRPGALTDAEQNGRRWRLSPEVALRGALQEFETIEWFRKMVRPGMAVIDVGANVGQMSLELGFLVGEQGKVLAIEPGRGNLEVLKAHLRANGMDRRVTVIEAACAETHGGEVEFYVAGDGPDCVGSGHSLAGAAAIHRGNPDIPVYTVQCKRVSIDGIVAEHRITPSLIKIDVEGAELQVLAGAKHTLAKVRPAVRVGFHPFAFEDVVSASDELRRIFAEAGYRMENAPATGPLELEEYVALPADFSD
jgi:FkbM family methyltransferase